MKPSDLLKVLAAGTLATLVLQGAGAFALDRRSLDPRAVQR